MISKAKNSVGTYSHNFKEILSEMRKHNYDAIRFATYRTASKIRFMQKYFHFHIIDQGNIIEALRILTDSISQAEDKKPMSDEININILRDFVLLELYQSLNRRLLPQSQINSVTTIISNLTSWLSSVYDSENSGKLKLFSVQIALVILCAGKYISKMKYIFSLISDESGYLVMDNYLDFCKEAIILPASLYEPASMEFNETSALALFDNKKTITLDEFLEVHLKYPGPYYLIWFSLVNRMAAVENVVHDVRCSICTIKPLKGFRYKCQNCCDVTLCQDCFWRGNIASKHTLEHEMKEFSSFRPNKPNFPIYRLPNGPSKCLPPYFTANAFRKSCGRRENLKRLGDSVTNLSVDQSILSREKSSLSRFNDTSSDTYSSLLDIRSLDPEENAVAEHNIITDLLGLLSQKGESREASIRYSSNTKLDTPPGFAGSSRDRKSRRTAIISYLEQRNKDIATEIMNLQRAKVYGSHQSQFNTPPDYSFPYGHRTLPSMGHRRKQQHAKQSNYATISSPIYDEPNHRNFDDEPSFVQVSDSEFQPTQLNETSPMQAMCHRKCGEQFKSGPDKYPFKISPGQKSSYQELRALWSKKDELESRMDELYRERMRLAAQLQNVMGVLGEEDRASNNRREFGTIDQVYKATRAPVLKGNFCPKPSSTTRLINDQNDFKARENNALSSIGTSLPNFFEHEPDFSCHNNSRPCLTPLIECSSSNLINVAHFKTPAQDNDYDYNQFYDGQTYLKATVAIKRNGNPSKTYVGKDACFVRNHLLIAADSVTNAMSNLVNELNTSDGEDIDPMNHYDQLKTFEPLDSNYSNYSPNNQSTTHSFRSQPKSNSTFMLPSENEGDFAINNKNRFNREAYYHKPEYEEYLERILEK